MVAFPTYNFSKEFVKVRFLEENAPIGIDKRWLGLPRGVYIGFNPQTTIGSSTLTLSVDPNHGFSLLKVGAESLPLQIDLFLGSNLELDFNGHTKYPVYVIARGDFRRGSSAQARILTRATPASGPQEVTICSINKVNGELVTDVSVPSSRQTPTAFLSQAFGFMNSGAVDQLDAAMVATAEIQAARNSLYTGSHPTLGDRIDDDLSGFEMANRLGLRSISIVSNSYTAIGGSTNVSGSFSETGREFGPTFTIPANGSESIEGAVTTSGRNYCFIVNDLTKQRLVNAADEPVYGELTFTSGSNGVGKAITFSNASTSVTGGGTFPFQVPLQAGDLILAPDGKYYELRTIIDPDTATLGAAFQGVSGVVIDTLFRRFTLTFFTVVGGAFSISASTPIRFLIPTFFRADRAIFDGSLLLKQDGERPPLPSATQATAGKALLAATGGLVGSIRTIRNNSLPIGNDIHTLNFQFGGATDAGSGVANVAVNGATGPTGPSAADGPTGPSGAAGLGFSTNVPFASSAFSATPTPVTISFTFDFAPTISNIEHLFGGFSGFDGKSPLETVKITSLAPISATEGRIIGDIALTGAGPSLSRFKLFLGAMQ